MGSSARGNVVHADEDDGVSPEIAKHIRASFRAGDRRSGPGPGPGPGAWGLGPGARARGTRPRARGPDPGPGSETSRRAQHTHP